MNLDYAVIIGPQRFADGVLQNLQATVEIALEGSGKVAFNVQREVAASHPFQKGFVQDSLSFKIEQSFLHFCLEAQCYRGKFATPLSVGIVLLVDARRKWECDAQPLSSTLRWPSLFHASISVRLARRL